MSLHPSAPSTLRSCATYHPVHAPCLGVGLDSWVAAIQQQFSDSGTLFLIHQTSANPFHRRIEHAPPSASPSSASTLHVLGHDSSWTGLRAVTQGYTVEYVSKIYILFNDIKKTLAIFIRSSPLHLIWLVGVGNLDTGPALYPKGYGLHQAFHRTNTDF